MSWPILSVTTFLPLVGALFIMMMRGEQPLLVRPAATARRTLSEVIVGDDAVARVVAAIHHVQIVV